MKAQKSDVPHPLERRNSSQSCTLFEEYSAVLSSNNCIQQQASLMRKVDVEKLPDTIVNLLKCVSEGAFFKDEWGDPYVRIRLGKSAGVYSLGRASTKLMDDLRAWHRDTFGQTVQLKHLSYVLEEARTFAMSSSNQWRISYRIGWLPGKIFIDLGDGTGRAIRIDNEGWRVVECEDSIPFHPIGKRSLLPIPKSGGTLEHLDQLLNLATFEDRMLVVGWLLGTFTPGPYPLLSFRGPQGSGKSTMAKILKRLVDQGAVEERDLIASSHEFSIAAHNTHVMVFGNFDRIKDHISNILCRASTGSGHTARTLYKNDQETSFSKRIPIILTSLAETIVLSDLASRSIQIDVPEIYDVDRDVEDDVLNLCRDFRPYILGFLCDAASYAIRNYESVRLARLPRLADFVKFVEAAAPALGLRQGQFSDIFVRNQNKSQLEAVYQSSIGPHILDLADCGLRPLSYTPTDWANYLHDRHSGPKGDLPKSGRSFSNMLKRIEPALKLLHIYVERSRSDVRWIKIFYEPSIEVDPYDEL